MIGMLMLDKMANMEMERRHAQAAQRRLAKLAAQGQPQLADRALAALGDAMVATGQRLRERHAAPGNGTLGWE